MRVKPDSLNSLVDTHKGRNVLERTAMKVARLVLRRGEGGNYLFLFDFI